MGTRHPQSPEISNLFFCDPKGHTMSSYYTQQYLPRYHVEYFFRPPSGPGALHAYGFRCSCGEVQATSLKTEQRLLAARHTDWHARQEER